MTSNEDQEIIATATEVIAGLTYLNGKKELIAEKDSAPKELLDIRKELEDELQRELRELVSNCVDILSDMEAVREKAREEETKINGL